MMMNTVIIISFLFALRSVCPAVLPQASGGLFSLEVNDTPGQSNDPNAWNPRVPGVMRSMVSLESQEEPMAMTNPGFGKKRSLEAFRPVVLFHLIRLRQPLADNDKGYDVGHLYRSIYETIRQLVRRRKRKVKRGTWSLAFQPSQVWFFETMMTYVLLLKWLKFTSHSKLLQQ